MSFEQFYKLSLGTMIFSDNKLWEKVDPYESYAEWFNAVCVDYEGEYYQKLFDESTLVRVCTAYELCCISEIGVELSKYRDTKIVSLETYKKRRSLSL